MTAWDLTTGSDLEVSLRAAVFYAPGDLRVEEVPEPAPGLGEIKIQISYNGICGTDLQQYFMTPTMVPLDAPHPLTGVCAPVILGHEAAGVVVELGPEVTDARVGDLVTIEPIVSCGNCVDCRAGAYNHCRMMAFHGYSTGGGGLAEYTVVHRKMAHIIPEGISAQQAALVEPMAVAYHAVQRAAIRGGEVSVVFGAGPIGIGTMFALQGEGATVVIIEPSEKRRLLAQKVGSTMALDPGAGDVAARILEMTDGRGAAACFDAAGAPGVLSEALRSVRVGGSIVIVGVPKESLKLTAAELFATEAFVSASTAYCGDFPPVIERMSQGEYPLDHWVTTVGLEDVVAEGFNRLHAGDGTKILVTPRPVVA